LIDRKVGGWRRSSKFLGSGIWCVIIGLVHCPISSAERDEQVHQQQPNALAQSISNLFDVSLITRPALASNL
jgi:hypothetical protein